MPIDHVSRGRVSYTPVPTHAAVVVDGRQASLGDAEGQPPEADDGWLP